MTDNSQLAQGSTLPQSDRPSVVALSILLVLLPVALVMLLAMWLQSEGIALLCVPVGVAMSWIALRRRGKSWADVGMKRPTRLAVVVALIATVLLFPLTGVFSEILKELTGWEADISAFDVLRGNVGALIAGLAVVWTIAAFGEELLFRGFLTHSLADLPPAEKRSLWTWMLALVVSSILFGLGHAYQGPAGMVLTAIIGLLFGLTFLAARRNLWAPILAHGLYDTAGFVIVFMSLDKPSGPSSFFLG